MPLRVSKNSVPDITLLQTVGGICHMYDSMVTEPNEAIVQRDLNVRMRAFSTTIANA